MKSYDGIIENVIWKMIKFMFFVYNQKQTERYQREDDERKRSFKPKPRALDSSDEESPSGSRKPRSKLNPGLDSSESDELAEDEKKSESKLYYQPFLGT